MNDWYEQDIGFEESYLKYCCNRNFLIWILEVEESAIFIHEIEALMSMGGYFKDLNKMKDARPFLVSGPFLISGLNIKRYCEFKLANINGKLF